MNTQPIKIFYETKLPYLVFLGVTSVGFFIGLLVIGGDVLNNIYLYFFSINLAAFIFVCFYNVSKFYIYEDKLIWKKGFCKMESPWSEVTGIHYDYAPNMWYVGRAFKSNNFFLEMNGSYTKYANEWNIREGQFTFRSKSKDLIEEIKRRSGVGEQVGEVSFFKQRQNLWGIIILIGSIVAIGLGGILYVQIFGV